MRLVIRSIGKSRSWELIGLRHSQQALKELTQLVKCACPERSCPLVFGVVERLARDLVHCCSPFREPDDPRAAIARVARPIDIAMPFEIGDKFSHRLLGKLCLPGELTNAGT
jgi:hypothetical protein